VFGLLSTAGTAYVGFGDPPGLVTGGVVVVTALAGFYGFRLNTEPYRTDKLTGPLDGTIITGPEPF
jgi:hypothetical protein